MTPKYDADYFLRGRETGQSLYQDYRWLPDLTRPMVARMVEFLKIEKGDRIADFGCARGYVVRAFVELGYEAFGIDISKWALENADEMVKDRVSNTWPTDVDWIIAKDTVEHLNGFDLVDTLRTFAQRARKGVFIIVPLSSVNNPRRYVVPDFEQDRTHVIRLPLGHWVAEVHGAFDQSEASDALWEISARHRVRGIKDNYAQYPKGNGFITCRRVGSAKC